MLAPARRGLVSGMACLAVEFVVSHALLHALLQHLRGEGDRWLEVKRLVPPPALALTLHRIALSKGLVQVVERLVPPPALALYLVLYVSDSAGTA